LIAARNL